MPALNNVTVGDTYTPAATIQFAYNPRGGWFVVGDQAGVIVQLQYQQGNQAGNRGRGSEEWAFDETVLGAGANGTIPTNAIGIRFRNAVLGANATVTAMIGTGEDPVLEIDSFGGSTSPAGAGILAQGHATGTHGTPTVLTGTSVPCEAVVVRANTVNTGLVYLGKTGVTTSTGYILNSNDAVGMDVDNPNAVFFDVDNTNDGVSWLCIG